MKQLRYLALAATIAASSCATVTPSAPSAPSGPAAIPSTPLDLGDYRRAGAPAVLNDFERAINSRYGQGVGLSAVTADLRRNEFNCAAPSSGAGDPPDQVCRRTVSASGCTHTWQVHLYDDAGSAGLARTRALYDRRCGDDGLLGGPS